MFLLCFPPLNLSFNGCVKRALDVFLSVYLNLKLPTKISLIVESSSDGFKVESRKIVPKEPRA